MHGPSLAALNEGYSLIVVLGLLIVVASLVEQGLSGVWTSVVAARGL